MSSIAKQPNGRWRARYRDPNGRSRSKTFDRKTDAQDFLDDSSTDARRGEWVDPRLRRQRFDEWSDRWWATTVRMQPTTRAGYWSKLQHHVLPYFTGRRIHEIDFMDVEDFIAALVGLGLKPKTIRECVTITSLIMKCAVKANVLRSNPASGHQLGIRPKRIGVGDVLDMDEALQLVEATREWWRAAVWLLVLTGMRPGELLGLKVRSIDFARQRVHVSASLRYVQAFDTVRSGYHEGPPKTAAGDREIPLPEWLCDDLAAFLAERRVKFGDGSVTPGAYLVVNTVGDKVSCNHFRQRVLKPALRKAGLPETIRTYDLRHGHASLLIHLGANPLAVAQRLGHTDPALTLRVYGHLFEGVQESLTDKLDEHRAAASDKKPTKGVVTPLRGRGSGHGQDTRDTRKTRKSGQRRSTSAKTG